METEVTFPDILVTLDDISGGITQLLSRDSRPFTGHSDDGEAIGAIGGDTDIENGIPETEDLSQFSPQGQIGWKDHDSRSIRTDPQFLLGTEHSLGNLSSDA
jgi:hypothetical protein